MVAPYEEEISRANPACFIFLIDQSGSMDEFIGGDGTPKGEETAQILNNWLREMIIRAADGDVIRDYMHVAILGYTTDAEANPIISSALPGPLADESIIPISRIDENPLNIVEIPGEQKLDEMTGEVVEMPPVQVPIWLETTTELGTPMCQALYDTYGLCEQWLSEHPTAFPPIVINITDGEATDGDPIAYAESVTSLANENGSNVLLFNCHLSGTPADSFQFVSNGEILPDKFAKDLFQMSSTLPEPLYQRALAENFQLQHGARGFVFNADTTSLLRFLDIGTKVAQVDPAQLR